MDAARKWVRECRSLCVLTGAGVSAESGVPTFRGPEGLWKMRDPMTLATPGRLRPIRGKCGSGTSGAGKGSGAAHRTRATRPSPRWRRSRPTSSS